MATRSRGSPPRARAASARASRLLAAARPSILEERTGALRRFQREHAQRIATLETRIESLEVDGLDEEAWERKDLMAETQLRGAVLECLETPDAYLESVSVIVLSDEFPETVHE